MNPSYEERFTQGDCHVLAGAINAITGWPFCTFSRNCDDGVCPDVHAFVLMPDGNCLDIRGVSSCSDMLVSWGEDGICVWGHPARASDADDMWHLSNVEWPASPRIADLIAPRLVADALDKVSRV